ncbi:hypothetical protein DB345_03940 [Spartobacteria bacterium LR76]|nr:hypothetical protein DB345_03940 [Spartobacteria bacterium LR76]
MPVHTLYILPVPSPVMTDSTHWYCVRTKPKNERLTSQLLRTEVGLPVFCPFIRFERARRTGRTWVTEAMFPGYIFARMDYTTQHRHLRSIRGVITIVGFGDNPAIVPDSIVEELRREVRDEETIVIQPEIAIGEEVNVVAGPFQGLRAVVSRVLPARERVAVLLEVLGMEREVEVAAAAILPDLPHPMSRS